MHVGVLYAYATLSFNRRYRELAVDGQPEPVQAYVFRVKFYSTRPVFFCLKLSSSGTAGGGLTHKINCGLGKSGAAR